MPLWRFFVDEGDVSGFTGSCGIPGSGGRDVEGFSTLAGLGSSSLM